MPITAQEALQRCIEHREIFHDEMLKVMRMIMSGEMSPVMAAAIITSLRVKKETIGEIAAAAEVMREFANKVEVDGGPHFVDIVGTGGDGSHTFNISTASMFVAAAAGATVAKHGNRGVSSKSGAPMCSKRLVRTSCSSPSNCRMYCGHRHGLHVRAESSSGDEKCCADPQGNGRADDLQYSRSADQSGRRAEHPDGRIHPDLVGIQVRVLQRLGAKHALVVWGRTAWMKFRWGLRRRWVS